MERLGHLRALLAARDRIEEVARAVVDASSDDDAVIYLSRLLNCSDAAALHVISTPLRMFRRGEGLAREIGELEAYLELP